jgi:hypothetical protein
MKPVALLKRFEDRFPLTCCLIEGIGGGSLFVCLARYAYLFFIAPELNRAFDCVIVSLATGWIILRVFKYAFR